MQCQWRNVGSLAMTLCRHGRAPTDMGRMAHCCHAPTLRCVHDGSRRAIVAAFLANLAIALAKFIGFLVTGAASMLAEAIHSAADTGNQGLLFLGGRQAQKSATDKHQFGHGRERYFWAFVVSLMLFSLGGVFALFEGEEKLRHPHQLESAWWAIGILAVAVVLEALSLRTAVRESRHARERGQSWWQFIRQAKIPELPVVLLEDVGALLGLAFALAGVVAAEITGNARFDAVGSLAIGVLLVSIASILAVEMKSLLIGESASPRRQAAIESAIAASPQIRQLIHIRTEHLGPDELLVAAKVAMDPALTLPEVARAIDETEVLIRAAVPAAKLIYLEPDCLRPT
jgi:cation diffusion facilitator family transporter